MPEMASAASSHLDQDHNSQSCLRPLADFLIYDRGLLQAEDHSPIESNQQEKALYGVALGQQQDQPTALVRGSFPDLFGPCIPKHQQLVSAPFAFVYEPVQGLNRFYPRHADEHYMY